MQLPELNTIAAFLAMAAAFGFIIFVHELGHFLAAKAVGIKVTQFAIGFGQSLLAWRKGIGFRVGSTEPEYERRLKAGEDADRFGETEYRFNWIPLGGYVKMLGQEDLDPAAASSDPRSFTQKPIWARTIVISAGVVMNIIFGVLFFVIAFSAGVAMPPAVVGDVIPGGPAESAYAVGHEGDPAYRGLKPGDRVVRIDDKMIHDFAQVQIAAGLAAKGDTLTVHVQRDGYGQPLQYRITPTVMPPMKLLSMGIASPASLRLFEDAIIPPALSQAGVKPGMTVVAVDGRPVDRYDQYERLIRQSLGRPLMVTFSDGQQQVTAPLAAAKADLMLDDRVARQLGLLTATRIKGTVKDSPAEQGGIRPGDLLAIVQNTSWPTWNEVADIVLAANGEPITLVVQRDGVLVQLDPIAPVGNKLGIELAAALDSDRIARAVPGSELGDRRLTPGSRIVSLNGQDVANLGEMQRLVLEALDAGQRQLTLGYEVNVAGNPRSEVVLTLSEEQAQAMRLGGWNEPLMAFEMLRTTIAVDNPWQATKLGLVKTHEFLLQTYLTLLRLFQRTVPVSEIHGPVGIAHVGTRVAQQGWTYLLFFMGLISVNLAVINFLPIPIVDGGHILFLVIEKLKGSPVSAKVQTAATVAGLALIGSIFLVTLFHDVARLFG